MKEAFTWSTRVLNNVSFSYEAICMNEDSAGGRDLEQVSPLIFFF